MLAGWGGWLWRGAWLGVLGGAGGGEGVLAGGGWLEGGNRLGLEGCWVEVGGCWLEGALAGWGRLAVEGGLAGRVFWGGLGGEGVLAGGCGVWLEGLAGGVVRVGAGERAV